MTRKFEPLPEKIQSLIIEYSVKLRGDPKHFLIGSDRYEIYKRLGAYRITTNAKKKQHYNDDYIAFRKQELISLSFGDYVFGWLAIITTRHVLFVWERITEFLPLKDILVIPTPKEIVKAGQNILNRTGDIEKISHDLSNVYNFPIEDSVRFDISRAYRAACSMLDFILNGNYFVDDFNRQDTIETVTEDYANLAAQAYCFEVENIAKLKSSKYRSIQQAKFSVSKSLDFWLWWLNEAIPQAWELAQQTVSYQDQPATPTT